MDWDTLGPIGVFLGVVGGGVAWIVDRWQTRADRKEDRMIEILKLSRDEAVTAASVEKANRIEWERRAIAWYRQLVDAGIDPDPSWGDGP